MDREVDIRADLLLFGYEQDLEVEFEEVSSTPVDHTPDLVATVLGHKVTPREFGAIASVVASKGGNIERIIRLARYPVFAYELGISGADHDSVRLALLEQAPLLNCDVAVHRKGLGRRAKRLVVLDVDSTLIQAEAIDLLAEEAGVHEEVADLTHRAMAGELDFDESLRKRLSLVAGTDVEVLDRVNQRIRLTPGARTFIRTLQRLGYQIALLSGGFTSVTEYLAEELGIVHAYANTLESVDGKLTGNTMGPIVNRERKAVLLQEIASKEGIPLDQVVAVGDGANDLDMLSAAGLGIAFNAKPAVRQAADTTLNVPYLDAVLFVLGITSSEINTPT